MKQFLLILAAMVSLLAGQTAYAGFYFSGYLSYPPAPSGDLTIDFRGCVEPSGSGGTYTALAVDIGAAASDRVLIIAAAGDDAASVFTLNSLSVGGDAASKVVETDQTTSVVSSSLWILPKSSGTAETITGEWSEVLGDGAVYCVYAIYGSAGLHATDFGVDFQTASDPSTIADLNVSAGGFVIGACHINNSVAVVTFTNLTYRTENFKPNLYLGDEMLPSGNPSYDVTCDGTGTQDSNFAAAAFAP